MWLPLQRRPSLEASLAHDSHGIVNGGLKKLFCQCCKSSSDRETVRSMWETAESKPYDRVYYFEKEVRGPCPFLRLLLSIHTDWRPQGHGTTYWPDNSSRLGTESSSISPSESVDLFKGIAPAVREDVSWGRSTVQRPPYEEYGESAGSSHESWTTESGHTDDGGSATHRKVGGKGASRGESEDRDSRVSTTASMADVPDQRNMTRRLQVFPVRSWNTSKYNIPAPWRRTPPPTHSLEEHSVPEAQPQGRRSRITDKKLKEHQKIDRVIRALKKQLDPLNYTDFWFTADKGDEALAFSNSVRRCMALTGTFDHETERLHSWLGMMMLEAKGGPHRLEFEVIMRGHLDKLLEDIVEFKSRPPTAPYRELQMVEIASDLLRYWRHRFANQFYLVNLHRQRRMLEEMLDGMAFKIPTLATPMGWIPNDAFEMVGLQAETEFEEGQW